MRFLLGGVWSIFCVLGGEWLLKKGLTFQLKGIRRGIWLQILAVFVTIGFPILIAFIMK